MDRRYKKKSFGRPSVTKYVSNTAKIGKNVKIWHFAYVGDETRIGDNVMIGSLTHIEYTHRGVSLHSSSHDYRKKCVHWPRSHLHERSLPNESQNGGRSCGGGSHYRRSGSN
jgi:acetyltransferase-like isoleucine patch superfamily enzyme